MSNARKVSSGGETQALATLLQLQRRAREAADEAELNFILANESYKLVRYRQAVVWLGKGGVVALSGVVTPEANTPYVHWLQRVLQHLQANDSTAQPRVIHGKDLPDEERQEWGDWLPAEALLLPLPAVGRNFSGGYLLLAREHPWQTAEVGMLSEWADAWSHVRALIQQESAWHDFWRKISGKSAALPTKPEKKSGWTVRVKQLLRRRSLQVVLIFGMVLSLPVNLTVLAPAELIPLDPYIIRAPLDGVVERLLVIPNQLVDEQAPLLEFDRTAIQNRLAIALGTLITARAEYRQWAQQTLIDPVNRAELAAAQGQIKERETEVAFLQDLLSRGVVSAPAAGMVMFNDPSEWVGRPVVTGERIMVLAAEQAVQVEAWLSPGDAIAMEQGARVKVYLNADPLKPVDARLRYVAHEAIERPDGQYAYRLRALLTEPPDERIRVGLKGTAKLEGERVSVAYWIIRRPLAATRAWLGI
jgi:multidrug efflux pump subunit AcrA (membrane-fusion protein)